MRAAVALVISVAAAAAPGPAPAETLVAARTIRPQEILMPGDVVPGGRTIPGALSDPDQVVGMEARVAIYAGRPIRAGDLGPPAIVERNAPVILRYNVNGLSIAAEGRALDRGAVGDRLKVMNMSSRTIVIGRIAEDGSVDVSALQGR